MDGEADLGFSYGLSASGGGGTTSLLASNYDYYGTPVVGLSLSYGLLAGGAHGGLAVANELPGSYGLSASTYNAEPFDLPQFSLTAAGVSGGVMVTDALTLGSVGLSAQMLVGATLGGTFSLPALDLLARLGSGSDLALGYGLAATATGGSIGSFAQVLPALSLAASGQNAIYLTGTPALPFVGLTAGMTVGSTGAAILPFRTPDLTASGTGGTVAQGAITLPAIRLTALGYTQTVITGGFSLGYDLRAERVGIAPSAQVSGTAFAMTARTGALTTYSNFGFNSFARFQGRNIAAGTAGLYELSGLTDAGTPVAARIRGTVNEAGVTQAKRLLSAFCGYKANGALEFRVRADQQGADNVYTMPPSDTGLYRNRVKFGRGATGSSWEWEIRNLGGAQFELDVIELEAVVLPRKRA